MELTYAEKKLITDVIVAELAEVVLTRDTIARWNTHTLPSAARKLAYYIEQEVNPKQLDDLVDTELYTRDLLESGGYAEYTIELWESQYRAERDILLGGE